MKQRLILACPPEQEAEAARRGLPLAHMAYRIGRGFHLYRAEKAPPNGGLMVLDGSGFMGYGSAPALTAEIIGECAARGYQGVVLSLPEKGPELFAALAAYLSEKAGSLELFVPPHLARAAKGAKVLIGTAVSGGTFEGYLRAGLEKHGSGRIALETEVTRMDFTLPAKSGSGRELNREELRELSARYGTKTFFSRELCAWYFNYSAQNEAHFVLYDNAGSIKHKLALAEKMGVSDAFLYYPEVRDYLSDITA